jgi:uncharacterized damage-inducible protein DinB
MAGMALAAGTLAVGAGAQVKAIAPGCTTSACDLQSEWLREAAQLASVVQAMPEDKFGFKPTPAQQTFAERAMHVAAVNLDILGTLGVAVPKPSINLKASTKADVTAALEQAQKYAMAVLEKLDDKQLAERIAAPAFMGPMASRQQIAYFLTAHSQDTYGQLVVYLRLNGITPPFSRQP